MSFHRVLPRPPALSNQDLADRWAIGPDTLRGARIMPDERSNTAFQDNNQITAPSSTEVISRKSSGHAEDIKPSDSGRESGQSPESNHQDEALITLHDTAAVDVDTWQGESPSQICLCQPDPKVPRPRNAFILYRQHHQASVVAQNPGVANPEISKVIGDHWRAAAPQVKEHWKLLAEEEKLRHQKLYPDYRYQPRRAGRTNSLQDSQHPAGSSASTQAHRCQKCGGKAIGGSNMISSGASMSAQGSPICSLPQTSAHGAMLPPTSRPNTPSGRFGRGPASPLQPGPRFPRTQTGHALPLASPRYTKRATDTSESSPKSPDPKRRRITNVAFAHARGPQGPQTPFPFSQPQQRRPSLPRPDFMGGVLPSPGGMGPPARPAGVGQQRSDSLKLPPLHTNQVPVHKRSRSSSSDAQAKSLEAMIYSIPLLNKIRVLGRISTPLPTSTSSASPLGFERKKGRGIIVAVDAVDIMTSKQVTETIERSLSHEYNLKVFSTPKLPDGERATFQSYLRLVDKYHTISQEVIAHVGGTMAGRDLDYPIASEHSVGDHEDEELPVSPKSFPRTRNSIAMSHKDSPPASPELSTEPKKLPVALLPSWQLTHTDAFAISVPITDAYSPMDHWQWHATCWRGTVGADATIAVQPTTGEEQSASPPGTASSGLNIAGTAHAQNGGTKGKPNSVATKDKGGAAGVDIRLDDGRAVIVQSGDKGVSEGALRRVGFEISEWVRGWADKDMAES